MHIHVCEVEEKGLFVIVSEESDCLFHVTFGECRLIGLRLDYLFVT